MCAFEVRRANALAVKRARVSFLPVGEFANVRHTERVNNSTTATPTSTATAASTAAGPASHGTVGLTQGTALYIAAVLGTGILVLPSLAAEAAGPSSILAVVALIVLSVPLAGTFAALAARNPDPGGVASYVRSTLGRMAARMTGYWFFFGVSVGTPTVALLGAGYVAEVLGVEHWVAFVIAPFLLLPPFIANLFGLRLSGKVQLVLSGLLVAVVVGVVVVAAPAADPTNFEPFMPHGWGGVGFAVSLFVWAFAGWEAVTHIAGEFKNPKKTIPAATGIAIVLVGAAYLALQWVTVAVLGDRAGDSPVPLLKLVEIAAPDWGRIAVASIAAIVALGVLNAYLGAFAKLGAALARDGDLPHWFAPGAASGEVPRRALLLVAALTTTYFTWIVVTGGDLTPFILIHTSSMVSVYVLGVIAAVRILDRYSVGWWMAVVSIVLVAGLVWLALGSLLPAVILAAAAVVVELVKRSRARVQARRSVRQ